MADRVYKYSSPENIATVRPHLDQRDSSFPYELLDEKGTVRSLSGYECNWTEHEVAGIQKFELCNVLFYGWTVDLLSREVAQGRDRHLSETIDISHECVKKERIAVPENRSWQRL
ncbi:hypothetical protein [Amphritea sp.]|uniref:hypothetical protein n=1 Tax=Amphritea sp. TaxID=1872502 RepID=UPI003D0AE141